MALLNSHRNQKPSQHRQTSLTRKHQPRYGKKTIPGKRTNCTQIELNNEPTKKLNNQANTFSVVENPYINHQSCVLPSFHIFWRGLVSLVTGCSLDKTVTSSYTDPPHNKPDITNSCKLRGVWLAKLKRDHLDNLNLTSSNEKQLAHCTPLESLSDWLERYGIGPKGNQNHYLPTKDS